jgi:putative restriction endonuclease
VIHADSLDTYLRVACFTALDQLRTRYGDDLPMRHGLDAGFMFEGVRVPFLNPQKGIFRARRQSGPAALSVMTSSSSPYEQDTETDDGFWYAYRRGEQGDRDNRALRAAGELGAPIVYFRSVLPGSYIALYPTYIEQDDSLERRVLLTPGRLRLGEAAPTLGVDREYAVREARVRLHQGRFRGLVIPAYARQCTICSLKQQRLLDAAHIRGDAHPDATAQVSNGLSLCTIHHRAFDQDLVGIDGDYRVHVAARLLDEEDGPMLALLKTFHGVPIKLPRRDAYRPDRKLLAERFERFARS